MIVMVGVVVYKSASINHIARRCFAFVGKYYMDMFLTHSFLFTLWPVTRKVIFATHNPLIIYLSLVASSLLLAIIIGKAKEMIGFNRLVERLRKEKR